MNLRKFALAAAMAAVAAPASALVPPPLGADVIDLELDISGASASDQFILGLLEDELCQAGTIDRFDGASGNHFAVACTVPAANVPNLSGNLNVLFRKRSEGGSAIGVGPVCDETAVTMLRVGTNCSETAPNSGQWDCADTNIAANRVSVVPDAGVSDVGPSEVKSEASTNCSVVKSVFGVIMGQPVTQKLRDALQAAQGLTVGSDTEADMPTLTSLDIVSAFTGPLQKWSQLQVNTGSGSVALTAAPGVTPPTPGFGEGDLVTLCRRVITSGTFASHAIKLEKDGCTVGALPILSFPNGGGDPANGPVVMPHNPGSSDVSRCLDALNDGRPNDVDPGFPFGSEWALGQQSTEKVPTSDSDDKNGYRFVKIDGNAPTIPNVAGGLYKFWVSSTIQYVDQATIGADRAALVDALAANAGNPQAVGGQIAVQPFGDGGSIALGVNGCDVEFNADGSVNTSLPCTPYTHAASGVTRNCVEQTLVPGKVAPLL